MRTITPNEIIATQSVEGKEINILEYLNLLSSGWGNDVYTSELNCINYYTLLKDTFIYLNYAMFKENNRDNNVFKTELLNINGFRHECISSIDKMFLDQYFDLLNGEDWNYSLFQLTGTQDCEKYYGTPYLPKYSNYLTVRDAYLNCISKLEIPQFISILKTLFMIHIISNRRWIRPITDNVPKVTLAY